MSTFDEQLATAFIAKVAGSTLFDIDNKTLNHSSSGPATRIDPKKFLTSLPQNQQTNAPTSDLQRRAVEESIRLATQMHPLPLTDIATHTPLPAQIPQQQAMAPQPTEDPNQLLFDFAQNQANGKIEDVLTELKFINKNLQKILEVVKQCDLQKILETIKQSDKEDNTRQRKIS
jgi:hypothetical protein